VLKSADGALRAVPFPVDDPERIPVQRYYDKDFYQLELEHLWPHVWQMACRLEQIPEVGDWVEYSNLGHSVLIVRTAAGVKAFHNACRHRGVPIAGGYGNDSGKVASGNCARSGFVCPFHGWRWNMDGENTLVYGKHLFSERQLEGEDINLVPCRVEVWGGCAWINFDDDAPSVKETFGPVADRLDAHRLGDLKMEWWFGTILPANWKLAMEAFMEGYHVLQTHPQLSIARRDAIKDMYAEPIAVDIAGDAKAKSRANMIEGITTRVAIESQIRGMEELSVGMGGMVQEKELEVMRDLRDIELPEDPALGVPTWFGKVQAEITRRLRERGEPVPDLNAVAVSDPVNAVEFLFPHFFLLPVFTSMSSYRIRPLGPETCLFEIWSLTMYPEDADYVAPMEPTMLPFDSDQFPPIPRQDYSNIPIQQKGVHAKGFEFMRLAQGIEGMISNYQRIVDGYLAGLPQEKLTPAIHKLGGNFDGPILDLEL
jgi:carnitine monooxygenase subunit